MEVRELALKGILELRPRVFSDERGYFFESFNEITFRQLGIESNFVQDNQSFSRAGVVRGLHFQNPPYQQGKLVRVIQGKVLDVVVDIRTNSPTYGQSLAVELDAKDMKMIYIAPGFAHGFAAMEDAVFQYKCTSNYNKDAESGIHPFDPTLNINWGVLHPLVSEKDTQLPNFSNLVSLFTL